MTLHGIEREIRGEIMKTDVFVKFFYPEGEEGAAASALEQAFARFRVFEKKYSRFRHDNELWSLNESTSQRVSEELFTLLERAQRAHGESAGLFDPAILPVLEQEGYEGAYATGHAPQHHTFAEVILEPETRTVRKPRDLKIDLGGIGKGFIVDQVSDFLAQRFEHSLVDAGGDMRARGADQSQNIDGWMIEIEDPRDPDASLGMVLLQNHGIATSGINRRRWKKDNEDKYHLIAPIEGRSVRPDLLTVTVIAPSATEADLMAKILFLSGRARAEELAESRELPAIFVSLKTVTINTYARRFLQ